MNEQLLRIVGGDPDAAIAMLKNRGVRVLQRMGNRLIIEGELKPKFAAEVSKVVHRVRPDSGNRRGTNRSQLDGHPRTRCERIVHLRQYEKF